MFNSSLDNTFKVGKNLAFELIGSIQTPMIQGTFDIETVYNPVSYTHLTLPTKA